MQDLIDTVMNPQFMATMLAAVAVFATVLSLAMPLLNQDRMAQRMKVMALERDKMRSARLAEMSAKDRMAAKLRQKPKGFMAQIVDRFDLRKQFDNEELRNKLKMAGLRGQAPLVAFMFFRVAVPPIAFLAALFYLLVVSTKNYPPMINLMIAVGAAFIGYYLPNIFIENLAQKRQLAIKQSFPDALDMLLICV